MMHRIGERQWMCRTKEGSPIKFAEAHWSLVEYHSRAEKIDYNWDP